MTMENKTFCNPVKFSDEKRHTNPDPFILRWCGKYYCYATDESGVKVSVSKDLVNWEYKGYAIREEGYKDYWAPSVLYWNGTFYMYYSNIGVEDEDNHQEHLKLATSKNPEEGFVWKKTFFNEFSIDSHPVIWNNKLYMFYSVNNWVGTEEKIAGTCILVDEMLSPEEFSGHPKAVIVPSMDQEIYARNREGDGRDWHTIEGAAPIVRGKYFWLCYSANAYVNVDYFVGTAVAVCKEKLTDMDWRKYPSDYIWHPLLKKNSEVEGTGHNTVTKAPNMVDEWIVYHGRNAKEELRPEIEQREMYIDPLYFNVEEVVCEGPSAAEQESPQLPEIQLYDKGIEEQSMLAKGSGYYLAEFWVSGIKAHSGMKYGIYLNYMDSYNYLELCISSGDKTMRIVRCRNGVRYCIGKQALDKGYDYTVPNCIQVKRVFDTYSVSLNEREFTFEDGFGCYNGNIGIKPYFTKLMLHSFSLTRTALLDGNKLGYMGEIFEMGDTARVDESGLYSDGRKLMLQNNMPDGNYTEVFTLAIQSEMNYAEFCRGNRKVLLKKDGLMPFSLYHFVREDKEWFLVDGKKTEDFMLTKEDASCRWELGGIKIVDYQITKIETKTQKNRA